jgi:hypothetical protein
MRRTSEQVQLTTDDISAKWKVVSDFSPRDRLFGQVEIICQIACKFTQQRLGLITFEKSKLEFTIHFNAENVDRHRNSVTNLEYLFTCRLIGKNVVLSKTLASPGGWGKT